MNFSKINLHKNNAKRNLFTMSKNLYIDASHPEETRIVLKSDTSIEEYEYENKNKINFKNNIYLGTVGRASHRFKLPL